MPVPGARPGASVVTRETTVGENIKFLDSFMPCIDLADVPLTSKVLRALGATTARLDKALRSFFHPSADHVLLWALIQLGWSHVEATPSGRRIRMRTSKTKRIASIPVTPAMGAILDATPRIRALILLSERGRPLTEHRASEGVRQWRDKAGPSADPRLRDARGTAATNLLGAGCSLGGIAAHMGWSLRYAANVIENYAAVAAEVSDEILVKLARARRA